MIKSKKIRASAKGEICSLQIPVVCSVWRGDDPEKETTVYCHFPFDGGMGIKSSDGISGGYGCHHCHRVIDGVDRLPTPYTKEDMEFFKRRSQSRTLVRLIEKEIVVIK